MSRTQVFAFAFGLVIASVATANVVAVSQEQLSVGTAFDVSGTGFKKRPAIWLDLAGRRIPVRLLKGGTDVLLHAKLADIPSRVHGDCVLKVKPRGTKIAFTLSGLSIELPHVTGVTPSAATAGTDVTIDGSSFGARRGKVEFDGRRGRIVSWSDTQIHAIIPAGLEVGTTGVVVTSKAGGSLEPAVVTLTQ
jgi:hypothetical protein